MKSKLKPRWSAKKEIKTLDALCRRAVFERDNHRCRKCGKDKEKAQLHWAHIITRAAKSTRWYLPNSMVLCYYHHFRWAHEYPLQFSEWVKKEIGQIAYDELILKSNAPYPLNPMSCDQWFQYLVEQGFKYGADNG